MNDEITIPIERGSCNCCLDENVEILTCSSNNKCEYAMCSTCIKNLKSISEQKKKCPHCREEIFSSDDDSDGSDDSGVVAPVDVELDYIRMRGCPCCLIERNTIVRMRRNIRSRVEFILNIYLYQPIMCCLYCCYSCFVLPFVACYFETQNCLGIKKIQNEKIRGLVTFLSILIFGIFVSLFCRLYYIMVLNLPLDLYWLVPPLVFLYSIVIGFIFIILTVFIVTFAVGCFCHQCCAEDDI